MRMLEFCFTNDFFIFDFFIFEPNVQDMPVQLGEIVIDIWCIGVSFIHRS